MKAWISTAAVVLLVGLAWFGRSAWGGYFLADDSPSMDIYHLSTLYDRWAHYLLQGTFPTWMPEFAAGYPAPASWMYGLLYPGHLLFAALPADMAWTWSALLHMVLGGVGVHRLVRSETGDDLAAVTAGLVFDLINIRAEHMGDGSEQPWYLRGSRVTRLLATWSAMGRVSDDTLQLYRDSFDPAINGANIDRFRAQMQRLTAFPRGSVVVVLYPLMIGFEDGYPLQGVHNGIRAMAEADGLPVLDLAPAFAGQDTESLWVHDVDHHPNGKAHAIAAKALAEWLRNDVRGFLDPR